MSGRIEGDARFVGFYGLSKIHNSSVAFVAPALHKFERIWRAINAALAVAGHVIGMSVRDKSVLCADAAIVESDVQIRKQNTVITRLGNIHEGGCRKITKYAKSNNANPTATIMAPLLVIILSSCVLLLMSLRFCCQRTS